MVLQKYAKSFLSYLNKDDFNGIRGHVDPLEYHSMFSKFSAFFGVKDFEKKSTWMYFSTVSCFTTAITGGVILFISFLHYMQTYEIHLITESGTYLLMLMHQILMTMIIVKGKKQYHSLLQALRDDYNFICEKGCKYREKFFENQRLTFKACFLVTIMTISVGSSLVVCAWIALFFSLEQSIKRPLPFPIWLYDYEHVSPIYEVLFVISMYMTFCYCSIYAFTMQSNVLWARVITCKADIIIWMLQDLLIDIVPAKTKVEQKLEIALLKQRMTEIIQMHQSMFMLIRDYAAVFKKCLLFEQIIISPVICMTAYCFFEKYDAGDTQLILLLLCIGYIVTEYVPNYLGTHLLEKVQSINTACWDIPFWNASGPTIRPYLVLIMQRSLHPLPLSAHGFAEISLKTYSTTITRAYSCFNMLRQADFNISK